MLSLIIISAICSYALALIWTAGHNLAMFWYEAWLRSEPVKITRIFYGSLYHSFVLMAWSVLYFAIKNYQELQAEKERKLKAEASAQRERLRALPSSKSCSKQRAIKISKFSCCPKPITA
ncbi:hypothetical protein FBQ85_17225 [Cytophagia bacterium CHB2]|nr:hypothetical protein [Cytophagia bacterium CHB2]